METEASKALLDAAADENGVAFISGVGVRYWKVNPTLREAVKYRKYIFVDTPEWNYVLREIFRGSEEEFAKAVYQSGKRASSYMEDGEQREYREVFCENERG